MNRLLFPILASCSTLLLSIPGAPQAKAATEPLLAAAEVPQSALPASDVIARVGDQDTTFGEIHTALNSSAVVGVSVPALGTTERDTVQIMLLDRFVSANLLYLDARKQGLDQDPAYRREVERFDNAMLASLYRQHSLVAQMEPTDGELKVFYQANRTSIVEPEARKIQMVVLKTKEKAADLKAKLDAGSMTM